MPPFFPCFLLKGSNLQMQHAIKTLKIIMGQSDSLLVVIKEEGSFMCTHNEQTYIPYSNAKTDPPGPPMCL